MGRCPRCSCIIVSTVATRLTEHVLFCKHGRHVSSHVTANRDVHNTTCIRWRLLTASRGKIELHASCQLDQCMRYCIWCSNQTHISVIAHSHINNYDLTKLHTPYTHYHIPAKMEILDFPTSICNKQRQTPFLSRRCHDIQYSSDKPMMTAVANAGWWGRISGMLMSTISALAQ